MNTDKYQHKYKKAFGVKKQVAQNSRYVDMIETPISDKVKERFYEKPYQLKVKEAQDKLKGG